MTTAVSYDFTGAVILVTGGASGIGAATARACAERGAKVIVADVADVRGIPDVDAQRVDVADPTAVKRLVAHIEATHGRLDAAVLGAAIQVRTSTENISDAEWRRHMAINLDGVFHCLREITPIMKRQRRGAIVTFTSGLVNMGWPGASAYAASKGAIIGLTRCVAQELRPFGVRANALAPGVTATPIFLNASTEAERAMYEGSIGISTPEDAAATVLYLISDASANLTGAVIERRLVPPS
jgi:NAD(P)-dependent dehydrogenase (short-subunit alcohol dehydrogenase family)